MFVENLRLRRSASAYTDDEVLTGTWHPRVGRDRMLLPPYAAGDGTDPETLTPDDCYRYSPWFRAAVVVGFLVARTPLVVKRITRSDAGEKREPDRDHPAYFALACQANPRETAGEMKFRLVQLMLTRGTGRAVIERAKDGLKVHPALPGELERRLVDGEVWYMRVGRLDAAKPAERYDAAFPAKDVLDLTMIRRADGQTPVAPWDLARYPVAEGIGGMRVRAARAKNSGRPAIALTSDQVLTKETVERIKADFQKRHAGYESSGEPIVLGQGLEVQSLSYSPEFAAEVELSKIPVRDVANLTGVPAVLLGDTEGVAADTLESLIRGFYQFGLGSYLWAMADQANAKCLTDDERRAESHVCEFQIPKLEWATVRDLAEIIRAYGAGTPIATPNNIRTIVGEPPLDDPEADKLHLPKNIGQDGQNNTPKPGDTAPAGRPRKRAALAEAVGGLVVRVLSSAERRASKDRAYLDFCGSVADDPDLRRVVGELYAAAGYPDADAGAALGVLQERLLAVAECPAGTLHDTFNAKFPVLSATLPDDMAAAAARE